MLCLKVPYNCDRFYIIKPNVFEIKSYMVLKSKVHLKEGVGKSHIICLIYWGQLYIYWTSSFDGFKIETKILVIDEKQLLGLYTKKNKAYLTQCASSTTKPASCPWDSRGKTNEINVKIYCSATRV